MSEFRKTTLRNEVDFLVGFPFKSDGYSSEGVRLLRGDNIAQGTLSWNDAKKWPASKSVNFESYALQEGDIVLAMDRPWIDAGLKYASVSRYDLPCLLVQRTARLRGGKNLDTQFLKYIIGSPQFTKYIKYITTGSLVPHISGDQIKDFGVHLPSLRDQKKIAAVLSALDAKIDCNNRINAELEAMAKALYDYWFVQFDFPFDFAQGKPDAHGKPYKSSGGKMVYNTTLKREIPEGWETGVLRQYIMLERGVTYGKDDVCTSSTKGAVGVLRATNVTGNVIDVDDLVYVPASLVSTMQTITKFSTLIVMSSGSKEHVGKNGIYFFDEPLSFGAFCSKITPDATARYFVNTFLQSFWFKAYIKNQCLGTNINNLTNDHINDCPIVRPNEGILRRFEDVVKAQYEKMAVNAIENHQLAQLRDWLLPLLMNGQVTVA